MTQIDDQRRTRRRSGRRERRSGFLYVAVLFTSLLVMACVAAAITQSTTQLRSQSDNVNRHAALRLAETEMQRLAAAMSNDDHWRTEMTHDVFSSYRKLLSGRVRHRLTDVDGDLQDDSADSVHLMVHAVVGQSEAAVGADLEPQRLPLSLLEYSITASSQIRLDDTAVVSTQRPVQTVAGVQGKSLETLVTPRLDWRTSGNVKVTLRGERGTESLVEPGDVVGRHVSVGTEINLGSLGFYFGTRAIHDVVLSDSWNPYGPTDPNGIYWIDAQHQMLRIVNCRIDATLVIRNAGDVKISGAVCWRCPDGVGVCLASDNDIEIDDMEAVLVEADRATNFNPPASPYLGVDADHDLSDRYPTGFQGLLCAQQAIAMDPDLNGMPLPITGAVVCEKLYVYSDVTIRSYDELLRSPPLGCQDLVPLQFVRGTFRRHISPSDSL